MGLRYERRWGTSEVEIYKKVIGGNKNNKEFLILTLNYEDSNLWEWSCKLRWVKAPKARTLLLLGLENKLIIWWNEQQLWHLTSPSLDPSPVTRQLCVWIPLPLLFCASRAPVVLSGCWRGNWFTAGEASAQIYVFLLSVILKEKVVLKDRRGKGNDKFTLFLFSLLIPLCLITSPFDWSQWYHNSFPSSSSLNILHFLLFWTHSIFVVAFTEAPYLVLTTFCNLLSSNKK